ncbi:7-carboxy-7-deazaguanine synthase [Bradyrhizobium elkanii]|uniref:7-carboxy-7-deazaguanine synthase n=1 Tax=Bradyrhizobium elkanii TaxID=29448 RepID=UPI002714A655|nr:7-carboxy-7-deazaguanine synthase [Bradyrhizobium elkanii]WLB09472.1 7-carboxy-7-deazaguanine synthase [Bradyrhizobium elkanii]WLB72582.1 7-carboxy-7-deazaguanine synthase [Bradyrhizobium elkanii]
MRYAVKEMFYSLQGEGRHAGRPAVFCRFAGCNLWSGRESDRATAACSFCDTDFVGTDGLGGGRFDGAKALAEAIEAMWDGVGGKRFVVLTGGEPLLQVDNALVSALHEADFEIAIETNGTLPVESPIDWITVSPKGATSLAQKSGNELKLVFPQKNVDPASFEDLAFDHFLLQPMDGPARDSNIVDAIAYCLRRPKWRLSLQTHKYMNIR